MTYQKKKKKKEKKKIKIIFFFLIQVIFIAPSGVQKERIQPNDMFIMHPTKEIELCQPKNTAYKKSQCTPLFFNAFR
jgi:ribulose-5-phosphate 4-epimerase/fuculose-1-phosphate aldolase